jgi:hypothetical protein
MSPVPNQPSSDYWSPTSSDGALEAGDVTDAGANVVACMVGGAGG